MKLRTWRYHITYRTTEGF